MGQACQMLCFAARGCGGWWVETSNWVVGEPEAAEGWMLSDTPPEPDGLEVREGSCWV